MPLDLLISYQSLPVFALVMSRIAGLVISAPLINNSGIPYQIRLSLVVGVAVVVFPLVQNTAPLNIGMAQVLTGSIGELMVGLGLGLGLQILLSGLFLAGHLVGQQAGISLGSVYNPTLEEESSAMADLYSMAGLACIFIAGVHRAIFLGLLESYQWVPLLSPLRPDSLPALFVDLLSSAFVLGLRLAGPGLIALLMLELGLGVLSRAMPQMNILSIGFSLRAMAAMAIAGLSLAASDDVLVQALEHGGDAITQSLRAMSG